AIAAVVLRAIGSLAGVLMSAKAVAGASGIGGDLKQREGDGEAKYDLSHPPHDGMKRANLQGLVVSRESQGDRHASTFHSEAPGKKSADSRSYLRVLKRTGLPDPVRCLVDLISFAVIVSLLFILAKPRIGRGDGRQITQAKADLFAYEAALESYRTHFG